MLTSARTRDRSPQLACFEGPNAESRDLPSKPCTHAHPRACLTLEPVGNVVPAECSLALSSLPILVPHRRLRASGFSSFAAVAHFSFLNEVLQLEPTEQEYVDRACDVLATLLGATQRACYR